MNTLRKTMTAAVAALAVSSGALATFDSAEAGQRYARHRGNSAAPVIAGLIGGVAIGALAASASRRSSPVYDQGYGYGYAPAPVYGHGYGYAPAPVYGNGYVQSRWGHRDDGRPQCFVQKQVVYDNWGNYAGKRKVRVCQ